MDSKSHQVSRTHLGILDDLKNVVLMFFPRPLIFKSSSSCINRLVTVPRAPVIIGITDIYDPVFLIPYYYYLLL